MEAEIFIKDLSLSILNASLSSLPLSVYWLHSHWFQTVWCCRGHIPFLAYQALHLRAPCIPLVLPMTTLLSSFSISLSFSLSLSLSPSFFFRCSKCVHHLSTPAFFSLMHSPYKKKRSINDSFSFNFTVSHTLLFLLAFQGQWWWELCELYAVGWWGHNSKENSGNRAPRGSRRAVGAGGLYSPSMLWKWEGETSESSTTIVIEGAIKYIYIYI